MADTKIEWTATFGPDGEVRPGSVWNPTRGCSRQSTGCVNCYAEQQAMRITRFDRGRGIAEGDGSYDGLVAMTSQGPKWTGEIRLVHDKLTEPLHWKRPRKVFVNSMSDLFHPGVPVDYIAEVFATMAYARWHTFIVLTKCAQRMHHVLNGAEFAQAFEDAQGLACAEAEEVLARRGEFSVHARRTDDIRAFEPTLPLRNVWLVVSTENQAAADERIPYLLGTPAAVAGISAEPLLGPISIDQRLLTPIQGTSQHGRRFIDWVIAGGESGRGARLVKPEWVRGLRDQCQAAGVPFFFKQWGGADKKEAGRLLDGREWNEFPEVAHG